MRPHDRSSQGQPHRLVFDELLLLQLEPAATAPGNSIRRPTSPWAAAEARALGGGFLDPVFLSAQHRPKSGVLR